MVWSVPIIKPVGPSTMLKLLLFVTWLAGSMSEGSLDPLSSLVKRSDKRLCGKFLVDALNLVCDGEYYDPNDNTRRRSVSLPQLDPYYDWMGLFLSQGDNNLDDINLQGSANQEKSQQIQRYQRGVVDECCRRPCSLSTLATYCKIKNDK